MQGTELSMRSTQIMSCQSEKETDRMISLGAPHFTDEETSQCRTCDLPSIIRQMVTELGLGAIFLTLNPQDLLLIFLACPWRERASVLSSIPSGREITNRHNLYFVLFCCQSTKVDSISPNNLILKNLLS